MNEQVLVVEADHWRGETGALLLERTADALEPRCITTVRGAGDRLTS
jgi:hypothetical protein